LLVYPLLKDFAEMVEWALNLEVKVATDDLFRVLVLILDNSRHILNIINITNHSGGGLG